MMFVLGRTAPNRCVHRTPYLAPAPMLCYRPSVWEGPVLPCVRFVALNKSSQVKSMTTLSQELRTSRARPRACPVRSLEPPETLVCGGSGSSPVISLSLSLSLPASSTEAPSAVRKKAKLRPPPAVFLFRG